MIYLTWSNLPSRWATPRLTLLVLSLVTGLATSSCPSDLTATAHDCFKAYNVRFHSVQRSSQKLCCGIDVETLRAFCRTYMDGRKCETRLRHRCPADRHHMIDAALANLNGAKDSLDQLCRDDTIIENYAMYQSCFTLAGRGSESCFRTHLEGKHGGGPSNIRFLSKVSTKNQADFCYKMRDTVSCIQKSVLRRCGQQAATLAAILVKPMVRGSMQCDYTPDVSETRDNSQQSFRGNPAYISDDHSADSNSKVGGRDNSRSSSSSTRKRKGSGNRNKASTTLPQSMFTALALSLFVWLLGL